MSETWQGLLNRPEIRFDPRRLAPVVGGRRVLITGAAGSIGSALARVIRDLAPERLTLLDWHEASLYQLEQGLGSDSTRPPFRYVLADVRDRRKIAQVLRRDPVDVIFHLAACKHVALGEANPDQAASVNVLGTLGLVEAASEHRVDTLVYPSTDKAVRPSSLYGATKRIAERMLQAMAEEGIGPAIRLVRLVNVFGTQGSVIESFAARIRAGQSLNLTDPGMDRYWMTMAEAGQLLLAAAARPKFEGIHLLNVGEPELVTETARKLSALLGESRMPAVRIIGARPGERLHEYLNYDDEIFQDTDLPGLRTLRLPPSTIGWADWVHTIGRFAADLYDLEPGSLRERIFELAATTNLARPLPSRGTRWV